MIFSLTPVIDYTCQCQNALQEVNISLLNKFLRILLPALPKSKWPFFLQEDSLRVYDAFVEALDPQELCIPIQPYRAVSHEYHPGAMLKLIIDGSKFRANAPINNTGLIKSVTNILKRFQRRT